MHYPKTSLDSDISPCCYQSQHAGIRNCTYVHTVLLISNLILTCTESRAYAYFLVYSIKTQIFGVFARMFRMLHMHTQDCSSSL